MDHNVGGVEIVDYRDDWPKRFAEVAAALRTALGTVAVRIDHIGSTSVPGLGAKNVIDVQISVADLKAGDHQVALRALGQRARKDTDNPDHTYYDFLDELGYELLDDPEELQHRFFRIPTEIPRQTHIHVCQSGGRWERRHLLFRDFLRAHPDDAAAYERAKREKAALFPEDRYAYTDAKDEWIHPAQERADVWALRTGWVLPEVAEPQATS